MVNKTSKKYLSTDEAAKILGISRIAVFKRIKNGTLPAQRIGRNYAIDPSALGLKGGKLTDQTKRRIGEAVKKAVEEYGEALRKLGKE